MVSRTDGALLPSPSFHPSLSSVCPSQNPPCVDSKRPRVYRHHAQHMCAWCRYTRRRFEPTHGGFSACQAAPHHTHNTTQHTTQHTHHSTPQHRTPHGDRDRERQRQRQTETERDRERRQKHRERQRKRDKTRQEKKREDKTRKEKTRQ